ncbi:MAG: hypothetical protein HY606_10805 [Planctomycetes bacterium]|nr:hypothetical protein [Planctomycetota bacterium]
MNKYSWFALTILPIIFSCSMGDQNLFTRAEITGYKETSLYSDINNLCKKFAEASNWISLKYIGKSHEGREIPLLLVNKKGIFDPVKAHQSDMLVIFIMCNIHAGEVEGKEAMMMILREIAQQKYKLNDDILLVVLPLFNIDGNEKIDPKNRMYDPVHLFGQIGPEKGVGTRYTGEGLNLNRDYMKAQSNEMKLMLREVYYKWLPHLTIDCHTTDGSFHGFQLTYGTAMNYSGESGPIDYVRTRLLPTVTKSLYERTGVHTFFYGNYKDEKDPSKGWMTYSHAPRYGSNYRGLTNKMDILLETYSYIPFEDRVKVIKDTLHEIFAFAQDNKTEIVEIVNSASQRTIEKGMKAADTFFISYNQTPEAYDDDVEIVLQNFIVTSQFDSSTGITRYTDYSRGQIEKVKTKFYGKFTGAKSVKRPFAYIIPGDLNEIINVLKIHNVKLFKLTESRDLSVEGYYISDVKNQDIPDCGHNPYKGVAVSASSYKKQMRFSESTVVVPLAQPQGNLVVYLLEPQSDDGLCLWNYFKFSTNTGNSYPIFRLNEAISDLPIKPVE